MFFYIYTMKMLEISISMIYGAIEGAIYTNKKGGGRIPKFCTYLK